MQPSVDVLLATHNGSEYVAQQINSILAQRDVQVVLTIIDDESSDTTRDILGHYSSRPNVNVIQQSPNRGPIRTFERLCHLVTREYFALSDQDDEWFPNKLTNSIAALDRDGADLVFSDLRVVSADGALMADSHWKRSGIEPRIAVDPVASVLYPSINGCTIVARRSLVPHLLPFPKCIPMHDRWIGLIASLVGRVAFLPEQLGNYRQHGNNLRGSSDRAEKLASAFSRTSWVGGLSKRLCLIRNARHVRDIPEMKFLDEYWRASRIQRIAQAHRLFRLLSARRHSIGAARIARELMASVAFSATGGSHE